MAKGKGSKGKGKKGKKVRGANKIALLERLHAGQVKAARKAGRKAPKLPEALKIARAAANKGTSSSKKKTKKKGGGSKAKKKGGGARKAARKPSKKKGARRGKAKKGGKKKSRTSQRVTALARRGAVSHKTDVNVRVSAAAEPKRSHGGSKKKGGHHHRRHAAEMMGENPFGWMEVGVGLFTATLGIVVQTAILRGGATHALTTKSGTGTDSKPLYADNPDTTGNYTGLLNGACVAAPVWLSWKTLLVAGAVGVVPIVGAAYIKEAAGRAALQMFGFGALLGLFGKLANDVLAKFFGRTSWGARIYVSEARAQTLQSAVQAKTLGTANDPTGNNPSTGLGARFTCTPCASKGLGRCCCNNKPSDAQQQQQTMAAQNPPAPNPKNPTADAPQSPGGNNPATGGNSGAAATAANNARQAAAQAAAALAGRTSNVRYMAQRGHNPAVSAISGR